MRNQHKSQCYQKSWNHKKLLYHQKPEHYHKSRYCYHGLNSLCFLSRLSCLPLNISKSSKNLNLVQCVTSAVTIYYFLASKAVFTPYRDNVPTKNFSKLFITLQIPKLRKVSLYYLLLPVINCDGSRKLIVRPRSIKFNKMSRTGILKIPSKGFVGSYYRT